MKKRVLFGVGLVAVIGLAAWLTGSLGRSTSVANSLGTTTSRGAVIEALAGTGYKITYRKTPDVEGYDMLAGRSEDRKGNQVEFSVVIRLAGPYNADPESRRGGSAQFPVVRYAEEGGSTIGNEVLHLQPQSPYVLKNIRNIGLGWVPSRGETSMSIRIETALRHLFSPRIRGAG